MLFGLTSGNISPFDINCLSGITGTGNRGSLFVTWATLNDYAASREDLLWRARDVLTWAGEKRLIVPIARTSPLKDAAEVHRLLEGRQVDGKVILLVDSDRKYT